MRGLTYLLDDGLCAGIAIAVNDLHDHLMGAGNGLRGTIDVDLAGMSLWEVLVDCDPRVGGGLEAPNSLAAASDDASDDMSGAADLQMMQIKVILIYTKAIFRPMLRV